MSWAMKVVMSTINVYHRMKDILENFRKCVYHDRTSVRNLETALLTYEAAPS